MNDEAVLVTGASGFLGSHLANRLTGQGQRIRALVRRSSDISHLERPERVQLFYVDLSDRESIRESVRGVSAIYHCAAKSADWGESNSFENANELGVANLAELAAEVGGFRRFLHVSTTDVYGYPEKAGDESLAVCDVGLPYNRTKIGGERALRRVATAKGLPFTILRPATIYGPRSESIVREIHTHLKRRSMIRISNGEPLAGLVYVDNLVDAAIEAAASARTLGETYNIVDDEAVSWREFVDELADRAQLKRPIWNVSEKTALRVASVCEAIWKGLQIQSRPPLTRHAALLLARSQQYDARKARSDFGFRSHVSYDEGMQRTIDWLRSLD